MYKLTCTAQTSVVQGSVVQGRWRWKHVRLWTGTDLNVNTGGYTVFNLNKLLDLSGPSFSFM